MKHPKTTYTLFALLLLFLFSESCSTNSRGLFEKRKHRKGWHFHKKQSVFQDGVAAERDMEVQKRDVICNDPSAPYLKNRDNVTNRKSKQIKLPKVERELVAIRSIRKAGNPQESPQNTKDINGAYDPSTPVSNTTGETSKKNTAQSRKGWQMNGAYFFLLLFFPFFFSKKRPNKVQRWAARNKSKSRALLVLAKVLLAASSTGLGLLLGAPFSLPLLLLSLGLIAVSIFTSEYWKQDGQMTNSKKLGLLGVLNVSASFGFFSLGGMLSNGFDFSQWSWVNGLLEASANSPGEMVHDPVYIIASMFILIICTGAALGLIGYLSCTISCNSSELLGTLVLIIGGLGVVYLASFLGLKLFERKNMTEQDKKKRYWWAALITLSIPMSYLIVLGVAFLF